MKQKWKIAVDAAMSLALLLLMAYGLIGEAAHEWIGMGMFVLFLLHLFLNQKWFRAVGKGRYSPARVLQIVLIVLIFLCMLGCMVSGIALSQHIFTFLSGHGGYSLARKTHMLCAYWGYICMAMHLGTNWGVLLGTARKGKKHNLYLSAAGWLLALLGIPTLLRRDLPDYLFLRSHFVFFDYSEPLVIFLTDYLLIAALFIGAGYGLMKLLRKRKVPSVSQKS